MSLVLGPGQVTIPRTANFMDLVSGLTLRHEGLGVILSEKGERGDLVIQVEADVEGLTVGDLLRYLAVRPE